MQSLRLTSLVENTATRQGLLAEHGLAFWLETDSKKVLFDTGQTGVLAHNADRLGVDLRSADAVVLSHGHYDHTGGLQALLDDGYAGPVYAHPAALRDKYGRNPDGTGRYIGMPPALRARLEGSPRLRQTESPTEIIDGLRVTGPVPRTTDFEDTGGSFFLDADCTQPDDLADDQAAFLDTPEGIVVILGCAHAGIINTLLAIKRFLPERPLRCVIGGTHLCDATERRMASTVAALREFGAPRLYPVHCTGFDAAARLRREFPDRVAPCPVGTTLTIPSFGA